MDLPEYRSGKEPPCATAGKQQPRMDKLGNVKTQAI